MLRREYDRLEAEARKHQTKSKYSLAGAEHAALAKSTAELMCHPQLKGKVATAIKEVLLHGAALQELVIGMVSLVSTVFVMACDTLTMCCAHTPERCTATDGTKFARKA